MIRDIIGHCPACGQERLHLMGGGLIACLNRDCPDPGALQKILRDPETGHIVSIEDDGWNVMHPLRERVDHELLRCPMLASVNMNVEAAYRRPPGRYRVTGSPGSWTWEQLDPAPEPG